MMQSKDITWLAKWICPAQDMGDIVPRYVRPFCTEKPIRAAYLSVTAIGVYEARINGARVGDFVLAPGWTDYDKRLQYQTYEVTSMLAVQNTLEILVGRGWYRSRMPWELYPRQKRYREYPAGLLAQLEILYADGTNEILPSDSSWGVSESNIRFSEIYDGEICDASREEAYAATAVVFDGPTHTLIRQQGVFVKEQEVLSCARILTTPKGEVIVDFGQEIAGYVETTLCAARGEIVDLSFAEVLDRDGNFYTANYRSAQCRYRYICRDGEQTWHPQLTFYGFRYIRVNAFPGGCDRVTTDTFRAVVLHSEIKRTGMIHTSNELLNRLFENCIWGQKGNFLDVPTDCPQRDERLGWTGDALAFTKTACLNFDVETFYVKWLADMAAEQHDNGYIGYVIPDLIEAPKACAAWSDAAAVVPWEVYLAYGSKKLLSDQFECMRKWVDHITQVTTTPCLWTGGSHNGDWLGLDAPTGSYMGSTRHDFIASAYYAHSTAIVVRAGHALRRDVSAYEQLYEKIVCAFRDAYPQYLTQTECALAVRFGLAPDGQAASDQLDSMVRTCGYLQTGFVGTPHLLHALSMYGHYETAYDLLLREAYPSWLFSVRQGATTIWEHWDGIMENGAFWDPQMNSFNHYAYGSVFDWVYTVAAGIQTCEDAPGYERIRIEPHPDGRLEHLSASVETRRGLVRSTWRKQDGLWRYEIITPTDSEIVIDAVTYHRKAGTYLFWGKIQT